MKTPVAPLRHAITAAALLCGAADAVAQGHVYAFDGPFQNDHLGVAVSGAGDVDGDGFADIVFGASFHAANGAESGLVRIHSGKTGVILHAYHGDAAKDRLGRSVSDAGDVDNDGFADVIAGAPNGANLHGYVRIWSGKTGGVVRTLVGDAAHDVFGWDVGAAGDVDGDGADDVLVGAVHAGVTGFESGLVRVYSGATGGILHNFLGGAKQHWFGWAVAGGGDADNDGVLDVLGGEPAAKSGGTDPGMARLHSGSDGSLLRSFVGTGYAKLGYDVAMPGDTNLDGFDDQLIASPWASPPVGIEAGLVDLVSGKDGAVLQTFIGDLAFDKLGISISAAGDIDQDGRPDFLIGSPDADCSGIDSGVVRAYSGADFSRLREWSNEQEILTWFGWAVRGAGDVNGDGVPDVVIGAPHDGAAGVDAGRTWVYSGACETPVTIGVADVGSGGFVPELRAAGGPPRIGNIRFRVEVDEALGGAQAALFIGVGAGQIVASWGSFYIDPTQPFGIVPLVLGGAAGAPGAGKITVLLPVPTDPLLVGFTGYFQTLIADPGSTGGIAHTAALEVTVCQ